MFIDLHCHLDFYSDGKIKEIVKRMKDSKVIGINSGIDNLTNIRTLELSQKYQNVLAALGGYSTDVEKLSEEELNEEIKFIKENSKKIVAISEVGLDLHHGKDLKKQEMGFRKFIELAIELNKPIIIHTRKAEERVLEILEEYDFGKFVLHCFMADKKLVKRARDDGFYFTVPSIIKYNEQFQSLVSEVPIEQLFCETDSPFLHPDKEQNNEPSNVIESYKKISEIKNISLKKVEKQVEENYKKIFQLYTL